MVLEKQTAFAQATEAGARALAAGGSPAQVVSRAAGPGASAARANSRRLRR
jgi:hypothetical protein